MRLVARHYSKMIALSALSLGPAAAGRRYHRITCSAFTSPRTWATNQNHIDKKGFYSTSLTLRNSMVNTLEAEFDWNDRIGLQHLFSLKEMGWHVNVDWRPTPYGAGLFAKQSIPKDTILRTGILGMNLIEFTSIAEIDNFCQIEPAKAHARREYVKDYMWGFSKHANYEGYPLDAEADMADDASRRFYGMWVPGNGLNHSPQPNTVYRQTPQGIDLIALTDIATDDELFDDYRRHGMAPSWLKEFAQLYNVTLNFADCNDFVEKGQ